MKYIFLLTLSISSFFVSGQKISIPPGVNYKYCDSATLYAGVAKIKNELSDTPGYSLNSGITFIGPTLWGRIKNDEKLSKIKGGDMIIKGIDKKNPTGKATSKAADFKLVWDFIRSEIGNEKYTFRKATYSEIEYYWYIIPFDIEEPLVILETTQHKYLINLSPGDLTLAWLDEIPPGK